MARSTTDIKKTSKKITPRGRPRTGIGTLIAVRVGERQLARLDQWIETLDDEPSRPEAIRRALTLALDMALRK